MTLVRCQRLAPALVVGVALLGASLPAAHAAPSGTGRLRIDVSGLPRAVDAKIRVEGPRKFSRKVTGNAVLRHLRPGRYTVTSTSVSSDSGTYQPQKGTVKLRVQNGQARVLNLFYGFAPLPPLPPLPPIPPE